MADFPIYNCHTHIFTSRNAPPDIIKLKLGNVWGSLFVATGLARRKWFIKFLIGLMKRFDGNSNDPLERQARFIETGNLGTQERVFKEIQSQYPEKTVFVALPMDMKFMNLGDPPESIDKQHEDLLKLAAKSEGCLIPFYAADPRRDGIIEKVRKSLGENKFRGVKIYPNLGYRPDDQRLMQIYSICEQGGFPVMSHCSHGGLWKHGYDEAERKSLGQPSNYKKILKAYPKLKLCLAHFGGTEEWEKQLKGRREVSETETWVKTIYDMIACGDYPNLYTDIAYTIFTPKIRDLYVDLVDYLKVVLSDQKIRSHVLFGSDYYMVEQEELTEKEVSIMLRSRLGEDLFFQIAHHNPMKFLGIKAN